MNKGLRLGLIVDCTALAIGFSILAKLSLSGGVSCFQNGKVAMALLATALLVFPLKALRFYLLLIGRGLPRRKFVLLFCMSSFVSILFPFKIWELFRVYIFGKALGDYIKGVSIICLDRFVDLLGLLSMMIAGVLMFSWTFEAPLVILLIGIAGVLVAVYSLLPSFLKYWRMSMLEARSTPGRIAVLEIIKFIHNAYLDVRQMLQGRFILLVLLSALSWGIEMSSLIVLRSTHYSGIDNLFPRYLEASLSQIRFLPQLNFIVMSSVVLLLVSVITLVSGIHKKTVTKQ